MTSRGADLPGLTRDPPTRVSEPDVLVIGGGPAGLTAAAQLAPRVAGPVLVLEREAEAGGIPRHSDHLGLRHPRPAPVLSGPAYARRLVRCGSARAPRSARTRRWSPAGRRTAPARGHQRRTAADSYAPRPSSWPPARANGPEPPGCIPGDRPDGVYTTGQLQNLVHLHHASPGTSAVVVGAELVSWSAVLTLREAGCRPVPMMTEHAPRRVVRRVQPGRPAGPADTGRHRHPASSASSAVDGSSRSRSRTAAPVQRRADRLRHRRVHRRLDPRPRAGPDGRPRPRPGTHSGPLVDTALRTSRPGVFAAGNLVHPVDTADVAASTGCTSPSRYAAG